MHLTRMSYSGVPPFTEPVQLNFDERVNVFVGPNASGKSTILLMLAECLNWPEQNSKRPLSQGDVNLRAAFFTDDEFVEFVSELVEKGQPPNVVAASEDWHGTRDEPIMSPEKLPAIYIGSVREGLPGISNQESPDTYGETAAKALAGPFSGSRTMCASYLLGEELWDEEIWRTERDDPPIKERGELIKAVELADACSLRICDEVIRDSNPHNYIHGYDVRGFLHHPQPHPEKIPILPLMGINTTDKRNFDILAFDEKPSYPAYREDLESVPIYLGHLSSGTEGTLLWIRWLALKMVYHYGLQQGWEKKPAILLIDEIENHLHPTWQRRVIPALLETLPGLADFCHNPLPLCGGRFKNWASAPAGSRRERRSHRYHQHGGHRGLDGGRDPAQHDGR